MNLYEFINKFIARNTLIRLWKAQDVEKPCGNKIMLTNDAVMDWEVLAVDELKKAAVVFITDIVCDKNKEAINIVIETDFSRENVIRIFSEQAKQRRKERKCACEKIPND